MEIEHDGTRAIKKKLSKVRPTLKNAQSPAGLPGLGQIAIFIKAVDRGPCRGQIPQNGCST